MDDSISSLCPRCNSQNDTALHLFERPGTMAARLHIFGNVNVPRHPVICPPIHSSPSQSQGGLSAESIQAGSKSDHHLRQMTVSPNSENNNNKNSTNTNNELGGQSEYTVRIFEPLANNKTNKWTTTYDNQNNWSDCSYTQPSIQAILSRYVMCANCEEQNIDVTFRHPTDH